MFRSIFVKTLRDQRTSALAWGTGFGALVVVIAAAWTKAYPDEGSRQLLLEQVQGGLSFAQMFYGEPHGIDRLPGWIEWRGIGILRLLLGFIAILTAARVTRGAEELGTIECVIAAASSRTRVFVEQAASVLAGLAISCVLIWAGMLAAGPLAGERAVDAWHSFLLAVNLYLAVVLSAGLALLAGHFTTSRRTAALVAGGAVMAMHIWDNLASITPAIEDARPISPFYLYSASSPLSEGQVNLPAFGGLALLGAGAVTLACWLVPRRDMRGVVKLPWQAAYQRAGAAIITAKYFRQELGLRSPFFHGLSDSRTAIAAWGVGLGLLAALVAAVTPGIREVWAERASSSALSGLIGTERITDNAVLSFALFGFLPLLVSLFALTLAAAWAAEEIDGRLELEVVSPISRVAIFAQRLGSSVFATALVIGLAGAGLFAAAAAAGIDLAWGDAILALVLLIPLAAAVIAFGYFVSGSEPRLVAPIGAAILLVSYLIEIVVPLFGWPDELSYLSVFHFYGRPLLDGPDWPSTLALVVATLILGGAGGVEFGRRDIAR